MSIDYSKSGRLAVNVLIDLSKLKLSAQATFDFINKSILPTEAMTKESLELLNDYSKWLPEHFLQHNCDLTKLAKLEVTIYTDFVKAIISMGMNNCREIIVHSSTKWQAVGQNEQIINITQTEIIKENFLKLRIPEFN